MELVNIKKNKIINKIITLFVITLLCLLITSCQKPTPTPPNEPAVNVEFPEEFIGSMKGKIIYVTSFGQSRDIEDLLIFLDNNQINYDKENMLLVEDVPQNSVVFAAVGCSIKGLETFNTSLEKEFKRTESFVNACKKNEITLITWHIGGMSRRGTTSDDFISLAFENSNLAIFVNSGNQDGFLMDAIEKGNTPYYAIDSVTGLDVPIKKLYDLE